MPKFSVLMHGKQLSMADAQGATAIGGVYAWRGVEASDQEVAGDKALQAILKDPVLTSEILDKIDAASFDVERIVKLPEDADLAKASSACIFYVEDWERARLRTGSEWAVPCSAFSVFLNLKRGVHDSSKAKHTIKGTLMPLTWPFGIAVALILGIAVWIFGHKADQKRLRRFDERVDLPIQESWKPFCLEQGIPLSVAEDALRTVENATGVLRGKLRPDDRFAEELAPEKGWEFDDGLAELQWELESRGLAGGAEVRTVGDFVKALAIKPASR